MLDLCEYRRVLSFGIVVNLWREFGASGRLGRLDSNNGQSIISQKVVLRLYCGARES